MAVAKARLGDVASIERKSVAPGAIADGSLYVGLEHISGGGDFEQVGPVLNGDLSSNKFAFDSGHVLFGKLRPYLKKTARPQFEGVCSTDILPLRPKAGKLDRDYLYHALRAPQFVALASLRATGVNLPRLSPKLLADLDIPLPPLEEQRRIAAILDKADALRAKRREAIAKLDQLLQSVFLEMFGDLRPTGEVVEDFALSEKGSIRTGPFGSQLLHSEFVDNGVSVLGIDNAVGNEFRWSGARFITEEKFRKLRRYSVYPGDVLITIMGTCGRCAVVPDDIPRAINTKHLCCISLDRDKCLPEFLHSYFLMHPVARQYLDRSAKGAIMSGLNMGIIKKLPLPTVALALQERFVRVKQKIQSVIASHQNQLDSLERLNSSLNQRAFVGRL